MISEICQVSPRTRRYIPIPVSSDIWLTVFHPVLFSPGQIPGQLAPIEAIDCTAGILNIRRKYVNIQSHVAGNQ